MSFSQRQTWWFMVLSDSSGKLLVYASSFTSNSKRVKPVSAAAERTASLLGLNVEVVVSKNRGGPVYVYYQNGEEEPVPIYCSKDEELDTQKIGKTLRNMMFVLSFHPKFPALRQVRKEIMLLS